MKSSYVQEGALLDILNYIGSKLDANSKINAANRNNGSMYLGGSISKYARNLTMTFPVLCDNTISIDTAQMISRANEKNISNMFQLLFSSISVKGGNGLEILQQYHKNITDTLGMDDYIDNLEDYLQNLPESAETALDLAKQRDAIREMTDQLKKLKYYPVNSLNEKSISDYLVRNNYAGNGVIVYEANPNKNVDVVSADTVYKANADRERDAKSKELKDRDFDQRNAQDAYKASLDTGRILPNEIKKANELQPTLLVINMNDVDPGSGRVVNRMSFLAGVKSRLISTEAMDIVERVIAKNKTRLDFKNLIRAATGEISFIKDFIMCIDQAKINAKNAVKKGESAKMWEVLEKRAVKNNLNALKRSGNDASAITTLVINQETVNYIKNTAKVDLNKPSEATKIINDYNLLSLVIADEANEVAKFLYYGNNSFEMVSYAGLAKDANSDLKKTINTINHIGR